MVVNSAEKTVTYYKNGVWAYAETYTNDSVNMYHIFYSNQSGTKTIRYNYMYYFAAYTPATTPAFQIVGTPTATEALIQFNTPVDPDSVKAMTVGGNVVTALDVSADYDEPNVFKLTYAELNDGTHTIRANGVTGLAPAVYDDASAAYVEGTPTALTLADQNFNLQSLTLSDFSISKDETVTATVQAINNRDREINFTMILAEYATDGNGNKIMTKVITGLKTADASDLTKHTLTLTPTAGDGYTYKAFVWADLCDVVPLSVAAEYPGN